MLERALVPLDGSTLAEQILPLVEDLATKLGAEVVLFQAVMTATEALLEAMPRGTAIGTEASSVELAQNVARRRVESERRAAQGYLDSIKAGLEAKGLKVQALVGEGAPAAAILDSAKETDASFIVMATHGRSGLGRIVFGSTADAVLRASSLPVFLVRPESA